MSNHIIVQKVLAAKSIDHGRWGALFAGLMQLPLLVLLIFPGVLARGVYEDIPDGDLVWPSLVFDFLPVGIRGLIIVALLAAIMSTLDSVLNGASSLVVNDFIKTRQRQFTERQLLMIGRVLVGVFMVLAAAWAPVITTFAGIVEYFQSFLGYVTMPLVVVLVGGLFWPRANDRAAFWTFVIGCPIGIVAFMTGEVLELHELQFLYGTGLMVLLSIGLYVGLSLTAPAPRREDLEGVVWTRETWQRETRELQDKPWYANYRYLAIGLVVVTLAAVIPLLN